MNELLKSYDCPLERKAILRLARSLHRVGIKRRNTGIAWYVEQGSRYCRDARDMVTFAREIAA